MQSGGTLINEILGNWESGTFMFTYVDKSSTDTNIESVVAWNILDYSSSPYLIFGTLNIILTNVALWIGNIWFKIDIYEFKLDSTLYKVDCWSSRYS